MKMLKYPLFLLAPLGQIHAADYTFNTLVPDASLTTGGSGFTLSESNASTPGPLAYVGLIAGSPAGALGGEFRDPINPSGVTLTLASSMMSEVTTVSLQMLIKDSTNAVPSRDIFRFGVADGSGASLVQLQLTPPVIPVLLPESSTGEWTLSYSIAGGAYTPTSISLTELALYSVSMQFSDESFAMSFGNTLFTENFSAMLPGFDGSTDGVGNFSVSWAPGSPSLPYGDNSILFDNLSITPVPEPSMPLLFGLASLLFLKRRRSA